VTINALAGDISFLDSSQLPDNKNAVFEAQLIPFEYLPPPEEYRGNFHNLNIFNYSKEDLEIFIDTMISEKKEPIGSMGDTARLAFLSDIPRSFFDFFYQDFAQVTNPPLDYIREKSVTDMRVYLGRKPNIFEPKELIPPKPSLVVSGPILSLGQLEHLKNKNPVAQAINCKVIETTFSKDADAPAFLARLDKITDECIESIKNGYSILILSDRTADADHLPIPSLLVLRAVGIGLNRTGRRLRTSVVLDSGDIKNAHHISCLMGFGATAICPYMLLEKAFYCDNEKLQNIPAVEREERLIEVLKSGVLRIMAKMGISVLRSYQGSQLFTILGLAPDVMDIFFPGKKMLVGGLSLAVLVEKIKNDAKYSNSGEIKKHFLFKEHATGKFGETHAMTSAKSRIVHKLVVAENEQDKKLLFDEFKNSINNSASFIRHLITFQSDRSSLKLDSVDSVEKILKTFGSGGMSFGAISAESQRDLILAFREIGGRANSGEGGENPFYATEGIYAHIKQIASGRFGVTCEYLITGDEVQIKIAQGAKPGEGGQLMGPKISKDIAAARFSTPGVSLISPAPQHDIYSIEDLKQLIYELKELKPSLKISVKLVSGNNIGAIAVGVVKAGADIIQISGGDGGTGAASLLSMKHAGLPLEIGLIEVHYALVKSDLRDRVLLRADGGLMTGKDVLLSAILGADQFDFGKIVLIAEGCIMARICEKNTCPTGIATQDPKFKEKYKGNKDKIIAFLKQLAIDVQYELSKIGYNSLQNIRGRTELLNKNPDTLELSQAKGFELTYFKNLCSPYESALAERARPYEPSELNKKIVHGINNNELLEFNIKNTDRAVAASLAGLYGALIVKEKINITPISWQSLNSNKSVQLTFEGCAGQGFGIFLTPEIKIKLYGSANDSVAKGICGGEVIIVPSKKAKFDPAKNSIIGNCALYGATSGELLVYGIGGDRFAVRNSGANAIIEGVGIHALEYMTGGTVFILGKTLGNIGAGMTGGVLYLISSEKDNINTDYIEQVDLTQEDEKYITQRLSHYKDKTGSSTASKIQEEIAANKQPLLKFLPIKI